MSCGHGGFYFIIVLGACAVAGIFRSRPFKTRKQGLAFERRLLYPAGTGAFHYFNLGRLRGGGSRGIETGLVL